jgi:hypothetical protein
MVHTSTGPILYSMASISAVSITVLFCGTILYAFSRLKRAKTNALPLPPGPKGFPILGNINDMPKPGILECHHWLQHKDLYGLCAHLVRAMQWVTHH